MKRTKTPLDAAQHQRLLARARRMRRNPTPEERSLWSALRARQLDSLKFRRQAIIAGFIVDFYCPSVGLVVELDGDWHGTAMDDKRDEVLGSLGLKVLRLPNDFVSSDLEAALRVIADAAARREGRSRT